VSTPPVPGFLRHLWLLWGLRLQIGLNRGSGRPSKLLAVATFAASSPLVAGQQQIWARAVDTLGRTQPLDGSVFWNPQGYTWNGVEKIEVQVG
jgi:hypothetical protein